MTPRSQGREISLHYYTASGKIVNKKPEYRYFCHGTISRYVTQKYLNSVKKAAVQKDSGFEAERYEISAC